MPSFRELFKYQSPFLNAEMIEPFLDLVIAGVRREVLTRKNGEGIKEEEETLLVDFVNTEKPLNLNKTSAIAVEKITGTDDYDQWAGTRVRLSTRVYTIDGSDRVGVIIEPAPENVGIEFNLAEGTNG